MMDSLFSEDKINFELPDAEVVYFPNFINEKKAKELYLHLLNDLKMILKV